MKEKTPKRRTEEIFSQITKVKILNKQSYERKVESNEKKNVSF